MCVCVSVVYRKRHAERERERESLEEAKEVEEPKKNKGKGICPCPGRRREREISPSLFLHRRRHKLCVYTKRERMVRTNCSAIYTCRICVKQRAEWNMETRSRTDIHTRCRHRRRSVFVVPLSLPLMTHPLCLCMCVCVCACMRTTYVHVHSTGHTRVCLYMCFFRRTKVPVLMLSLRRRSRATRNLPTASPMMRMTKKWMAKWIRRHRNQSRTRIIPMRRTTTMKITHSIVRSSSTTMMI